MERLYELLFEKRVNIIISDAFGRVLTINFDI